MKKQVEYQLTPKGEELSRKMDQKNTDVVVEVDEIKKKIKKLEWKKEELIMNWKGEKYTLAYDKIYRAEKGKDNSQPTTMPCYTWILADFAWVLIPTLHHKLSQLMEI